MALYDSADLLARVGYRLKRPTSDEALTSAIIYALMTEAQDAITKRLAAYVPDALWTVPTQLTSADGGFTYTFGTDTDSAAIFALGQFKVYPESSSIPDWPLVEGQDFTVENTKIRMPYHTVGAFPSGGPVSQYVAPSNVIDGSTQPTIPKMARLALISETSRRCAVRLGNWTLADEQQQEYDRDWIDILTAIRTQAYGKGGKTTTERMGATMRRWWR